MSSENHFTASVAVELSQSAQRLVEEYEGTYGSTSPGCCPQALAAVLDHLAWAWEDGSGPFVRCSTLHELAGQLRGKP